MQELEKIKKHNRILNVTLIIFLLIIVVLVSILLFSNNKSSVSENPLSEIEKISIETPYCVLEYPAEASEQLECQDKEENGIYSKIFYGCINDKKFELFEISFGEKENAQHIGYIINNGKKYPVYVKSTELDNTLDKNSQNTLYMMQEGINNVIQSITSNKNYLEE